eukprot:CAMPEP_0169109364 /NCGR_PEP_ID=MMETSP1015-20121227/25927_1 /TAXON_ID=342587 /ORGANISM="Karlodinium micrum, Strain CCMP2283" /LENGTH=430 /DNA_ID=CAMNT_0009171059 /DNA_START=52 /DNA_END=1344 /DNA_ORIENTATION=+
MQDSDNEFKLYVGGLPPEITEDELNTVFRTYGEVVKVHVLDSKAQNGARAAFVMYSQKDAAEDAIKVLNGQYKIRHDAVRPIDVNWAKGKRDRAEEAPPQFNSENKLFVGSLPTECTEEELRIVFGTYGEVTGVKLMEPNSASGQRAAFVMYAQRESAEDAIQVLHEIYKIRADAEKPIIVRWAHDKSKGGGKGKDSKGSDRSWGNNRSDDWNSSNSSWGNSSRGNDSGQSNDRSSSGNSWQDKSWQDKSDKSWQGNSWQDSRQDSRQDKSWSNNSQSNSWQSKTDSSWQSNNDKNSSWQSNDWNSRGGSSGGYDNNQGWDKSSGNSSYGKSGGSGKGDGDGKKLFVGNLPQDIEESAVRYVFGTYGKVANVHIMSTKPTDRGSVAAFVEYENAEEAATAISSLDGKYEIRQGHGELQVKVARPPRPKPY